MRQSKSLKWHLFLLPAVSIILVFCTLFAAFNLAFEKYIQKESEKHIDTLFQKLDLYHQNIGYDGFYDESTEFIMQVHYLILDSNQQLLFPEEEWASPQEIQRANAAATGFRTIHDHAKDIGKFKLGTESYYVKAREYKGSYDSFFITDDGEDVYTVLAYINITAFQNFLDMANHVLLILIPISGLITIVLIFIIARKIDLSFIQLNRYIQQLGQRTEKNKPKRSAYKEFNELAQTVYRMSKEVEQAQESRKQFFQNASHELKTPLMSILGYAEAIRSGVSVNPKNDFDIIIGASRKMSTLVDEILLLSKMDSNMNVLEPEILDLKELLYGASWCLQETPKYKHIRISHHFPPERILVFGDEQKLERAFSNILTNALRYARSEIQITCETGQDFVFVRIQDDGDGIDEKDIGHIFERFYKGRGGNFGIGLSITREIIHLHKGGIEAKSVPGCTIFSVKLPLYKSV